MICLRSDYPLHNFDKCATYLGLRQERWLQLPQLWVEYSIQGVKPVLNSWIT